MIKNLIILYPDSVLKSHLRKKPANSILLTGLSYNYVTISTNSETQLHLF
jgi:hypothetical protein